MHHQFQLESPDKSKRIGKSGRSKWLLSRIANSVFSFYYTALLYSENSELLALIISTVQWIQMLLIFFDKQFSDIWMESDVNDQLKTLAKLFHITHLINSAGFSYILTCVVCLTVIMMLIYASGIINTVYYTNDKVNLSSLTAFNHYCLMLFPSVLFIPVLESYLTFFVCQRDIEGVLRMEEHDTECFKGQHLVGFCFSVFGMLLFLIYVFASTILHLETRTGSRNIMASRMTMGFFWFKIIALVNIVFIHIWKNDHLTSGFIIFNLICCFFLINLFHTRQQFYSRWVSKVWSLGSLIFCWTSICLCASKNVDKKILSDIVYLYISGIALVLTVDFMRRQDIILPLIISPKIFKSSDELLHYLHYLIELAWKYFNNSRVIKQINGFTTFHAERCTVLTCPLKKKFINNGPDSNLTDNFHNFTFNILLSYMSVCFDQGISLCEGDIRFRLEYIFFLIELKNDKKAAIHHLKIAASLNPGLQESFIIYRYKKLIEEIPCESRYLTDVSSEREEAINYLAYLSATKGLEEGMRNISYLFIDLWRTLDVKKPSINRVMDLGRRIFKAKSNISLAWIEFDKSFKYNKTKQMLLFGRYLEVVWGHSGKNIVNTGSINIQNEIAMRSDLNSFTIDKTVSEFNGASFIISGEIDDIGSIIDVNAQACVLFGYEKKELIGRSINIMMHPKLAKTHNNIIINANTKRNLKHFVNARKVYAMDRNEYLLEVNLAIKKLHSLKVFYVSHITPVKRLDTDSIVASWLVDSEGKILTVSKGCILLFGIYRIDVENDRALDVFFPGLFKKREDFKSDEFKKVDFGMVKVRTFKKDINSLHLSVEELHYQLQREPTYVFHFKKRVVMESTTVANIVNMNTFDRFFFLYSFQLSKIVAGEGIGHKLNSDNVHTHTHSGIRYTEISNMVENHKVDYGSGIKVLRLERGKLVDFPDEDSEIVSQASKTGPGNERTSKITALPSEEDFTLHMSKSPVVNSKIKEHLSASRIPTFFTMYAVLSIVSAVSILLVIVVSFNMKLRSTSKLNSYISMYEHFGDTVYKLQTISNLVSELLLIKEAEIPYLKEDEIRNSIENTIVQIECLDRQITDLIFEINDVKIRYKLLEENLDFNVSSRVSSLDYNAILKHFIAKTYTILKSDLADLSIDMPEVYFVTMNALDVFSNETKQISDFIVEETFSLIRNRRRSSIYLLSLFVAFAIGGILYFAYELKLRLFKSRILRLLLELKRNDLDNYIVQNSDFIKIIESDKVEDIYIDGEPPVSAFEEEDDDDTAAVSLKSTKHYSGKLHMNCRYLLFYAGMFILIELLFGCSLLSDNKSMAKAERLLAEYNTTTVARAEYSKAMNLVYTYVLNSGKLEFRIGNQTAQERFNLTSHDLDNLLSDLYRKELENTKFHTEAHRERIDYMLNNDFCRYLTEYKSTLPQGSYGTFNSTMCETLYPNAIVGYLLKDGVSVSLANYNKNLNLIVRGYMAFESSNYTDYSKITPLGCLNSNLTSYSCVFNNVNAQENHAFTENGLKNLFYVWASEILEDIQTHYINASHKIQTLYLSILLVFVAALFISFNFRYLRFQIKEIRLAHDLLLLIPSEAIKDYNKIRSYFRNRIHERL